MPHLGGDWLLRMWLLLLGVELSLAATYKMALVGPWSCDPLFNRAMASTAANLALSRINSDSSLNGGFWYDVSLVDEPCSSSHALKSLAELKGEGHTFLGPFNPALCPAASLLANHWKAGLASPGCLDADWSSLPPIPPPPRVLFSVLRFFQWAHVGVVSAPSDLWEATGEELASALRALGLLVGPVVTMDKEGEGARAALQTIRQADKVKVVIMCMSSVLIGGEQQRDLLLEAQEMDMMSEGYVFIPYDALLYALPYQDAAFPQLTNDTQLRYAYRSVVTITMDSDESFYEAFNKAQLRKEIRSSITPRQVSPLFGTIYNMVYFVAKAVEERRQAGGGRWVKGSQLLQSEGGFEFRGFNQVLYGGAGGQGMQARYVVLDASGDRLVPTHTLGHAHTYGTLGGLRPMGRSFFFPAGKPPSSNFCWFSPDTACSHGLYQANLGGGFSEVTFLLFFILVCLLMGGGIYYMSRRVTGKSNSKLLMTSDDLVFINPNKKQNEVGSITKSFVEIKTPQHSMAKSYIQADPELSNTALLEPCWRYTHTHYKSYIQADPELSNTALLEGDWVWLKKFPGGENVPGVSTVTQNLFNELREMRHENLNLYLGLFLDLGIFAVVMEHCPRGSLTDLMADSNMRLDWMFKSSLIMDLIKGIKYLHMRGISHGRLKSSNCLVDGRFVLKVTDYGIPMILSSQQLSLPEEPQDLLWTAPELLSQPVCGGTFPGDVFSFAIIVHEVISRSAPYACLDMPAHEVVERVRCSTPLFRPSVNMDDAPLECLSMMECCWSQEPDQRPTLHEVFKQFKNSNKGKRANIIDSMLRMLEQYSANLEDLIRERTDELEVERTKTDKLLGQLLPKSVAQALKLGKPVRPEHYSESTLYFSDIVGFTTISALSEPIEVVDLLNDLYTMFDAIIASHDVYKVETIGDAYMVASGVPTRNENRHAAEVSNMSLDILHSIGTFRIKHMPDVKVKIRIGLHSGPVVAGVVGLTMPRYCLFGDTVTTASLMESSGLPYRIHIHRCTATILQSLNLGYKMDTRVAQVKDSEDTYWLMGRDGFTKPLPVPPDLLPGASNHGISLDEIPVERRQKFLDRQAKQTKK
ncbi:retinal guanylyl cyclase 1 [Aplochiton taeniatus]